MAEPDKPFGLLTVQGLFSCRQDLICFIGDLLRQRNGNAADRIYDIGNIHAVQFHISIDIDAEVFLNGIDHTLDRCYAGFLSAVINAVELCGGMGSIIRHVGVTGNLQNVHAACYQVELQYPVYIRQFAAFVHAQKQDGILSLNGLLQIQSVIYIRIQIAFQIQ